MKIQLLLIAIWWHYCYADDLLIEVADGKVQGTTVNDTSGRQFYAWRKIPFAKPPVGELRFKPPVKPERWNGTLDGTKDGLACIQGGNEQYSEDCLFINVYTPVKPRANLSLPVMYWIYGGGFTSGSAQFKVFGPQEILKDDVIYVSANYRLGVYGFLSLEDQVLPGNAGLKDQLAAIKWTKQNIARFGGNPDDITIFGESAGSMSVAYHLLSPLSKNLFKGAIMESGSGIVSNLFNQNARQNALSLAQSIDHSINNKTPLKDVLRVLQGANASTISKFAVQGYSPVFEVVEGNPEPFLPNNRYAYESFESGNYNQVPVIIGVNSEEYLGFMGDVNRAKAAAAAADANPLQLVPRMNLKPGVNRSQVANEIYKFYVGNGSFAQNLSSFIKFESESFMLRTSIKQALLQSKFKSAYFYIFSYAGTPSSKHPVIPDCGRVGHGDELAYLFNTNFNTPVANEADYLARKRFVKLWTNFAKFKNPTPNDTSAALLQNVKWQPINATSLQYLDIDANLKLKTGLIANKVAFWDYIWNTYATRPYNTY